MIQYQVDLNLRIEDRNSLQPFFVMDLGNKNTVILGHPWLTRTNPLINWTAGTVRMRGTTFQLGKGTGRSLRQTQRNVPIGTSDQDAGHYQAILRHD